MKSAKEVIILIQSDQKNVIPQQMVEEALLMSELFNINEQKNKFKKSQQIVQIDDHINFSQLLSKNQEQIENQFGLSLSKAINSENLSTLTSIYGRKNDVVNLMSVSKLFCLHSIIGILESDSILFTDERYLCIEILYTLCKDFETCSTLRFLRTSYDLIGDHLTSLQRKIASNCDMPFNNKKVSFTYVV
jgi:hypothetical protein